MNFKKDVKNRGNELNNSFRINKSVKKRTQDELETNWENVLKMRKKGQNEAKKFPQKGILHGDESTLSEIPLRSPDGLTDRNGRLKAS